MTATPWLTWANIRVPGLYMWPPPGTQTPNPGSPPPATVVHGPAVPPQSVNGTNTLSTTVLVSGSSTSWQAGAQTALYANAVKGSNVITTPTSAGIYPGQLLRQTYQQTGSGLNGWLIPNGVQITEVIPGASGQDAQLVIDAPAWGTTTNAFPCVAVDLQPMGTLTVTVTPSTGVTIVGYNFDGTTDASHTDNGTLMSNYSGEADGDFCIAFASAGTFTVSVAFTSNDSNYSNATITYPLTVNAT